MAPVPARRPVVRLPLGSLRTCGYAISRQRLWNSSDEQEHQSPPTLAELRARREEIVRLANRYGAFNVRVFGSVARGEANTDSDIDLLISAREGVSMFDLVGL